MRPAVGTFAAALAVRLAFLAQWRATPWWGRPQLDDHVNLLWAREIAAGHWARDAAFYQSPPYAYLLALVLKAGGSPAAMLALQAGAGAVACAVLARAAEKAYGTRAAWATGALAAAFAPFLLPGVLLLKETWLVLFLALHLLEETPPAKGRDALSGAWLGLAVLCRGNAAFLALRALWTRRADRKGALAFAAAAALTVAPATLHNAARGGGFVPVASTSGWALWMGNNPEANGTLKYPEGVSSNPLLEEGQVADLASREAGRPLSAGEVSRHWSRKALAWAASHPLDWAGLSLRKARLLLDPYELPDDYDPAFVAGHFPTLLSWPLPGARAAGALGLLGAAVAGGPAAALGALYAATLVLTLVTGRYRAPLGVFLLPLAGAFLAALLEKGAAKRLAAARSRLALAAPLALLCLWPGVRRLPEDDAPGWVSLCQAFYESGDDAAAQDAFLRAAAVSPSGLPAGAFLFAGAAAERAGDLARARLYYGAGVELHPDSAVLKERLGLLPPLGRVSGPARPKGGRATLTR